MPDPTPVTGDTSAGAMIRDTNGNTSSTRVAGFFALGNLAAMMWIGQLTAHPMSLEAMWTLGAFSFGCFGMKWLEWKPKT